MLVQVSENRYLSSSIYAVKMLMKFFDGQSTINVFETSNGNQMASQRSHLRENRPCPVNFSGFLNTLLHEVNKLGF